MDNVNATAAAMKKEIAELKAAIQSTDPKAAADALASTKRGAYAQQVELAKAYLFFWFVCFAYPPPFFLQSVPFFFFFSLILAFVLT